MNDDISRCFKNYGISLCYFILLIFSIFFDFFVISLQLIRYANESWKGFDVSRVLNSVFQFDLQARNFLHNNLRNRAILK